MRACRRRYFGEDTTNRTASPVNTDPLKMLSPRATRRLRRSSAESFPESSPVSYTHLTLPTN